MISLMQLNTSQTFWSFWVQRRLKWRPLTLVTTKSTWFTFGPLYPLHFYKQISHTIIIYNGNNGFLDTTHFGTGWKFCQLDFKAFVLFLFLQNLMITKQLWIWLTWIWYLHVQEKTAIDDNYIFCKLHKLHKLDNIFYHFTATLFWVQWEMQSVRHVWKWSLNFNWPGHHGYWFPTFLSSHHARRW